jgi:uncharacterized membrane protein YsdA (DUF1294 family)
MVGQWESVIIALNVLAFLIMGYDKSAARKKRQRVPEKLLFLIAIIGGSAGVWLGMKSFRHKTQHTSFMYGIPLIIGVQVALLLYFSLRTG